MTSIRFLAFLAFGIQLEVSLLHVTDFSTAADFPTGGPPSVEVSAAVIPV